MDTGTTRVLLHGWLGAGCGVLAFRVGGMAWQSEIQCRVHTPNRKSSQSALEGSNGASRQAALTHEGPSKLTVAEGGVPQSRPVRLPVGAVLAVLEGQQWLACSAGFGSKAAMRELERGGCRAPGRGVAALEAQLKQQANAGKWGAIASQVQSAGALCTV